MIEHEVPWGRAGVLRVREAGNPDGAAVFFFHGSPGCRFLYEPHVRLAAARGIRLLSYDRPGYGGSTPSPGRAVVDSAKEVEAIARALHIDRWGVWGFSGGGPSALACAARLPRTVVAAVSGAAPAPYGAEGLDWLQGMAPPNRDDVEMLLADREAWEKKGRSEREEMLHLTVDAMRGAFAAMRSPADERAVTDEFLAYLLSSFQEGLRPGFEGIRDDNIAQVSPWGFDVDDITVPVQIWHGGQDRFVPISHGQWLARHTSGSEAHFEPDLGHSSLFLTRALPVLDWLKDRF